MDYSEIQFGNFEPEFDLSPDITGSNFQPHQKEEKSNTDLPDNFWFQNKSGFNFISNNDKKGIVDDKFSNEITNNEQRVVIDKVYKMAMQGYPALELEKTLKLSFSPRDFESNPFLRESLFLLPLMGPVLWACWPFKSEEEARMELKQRKGIRPVFITESSKCHSCQHKNSLSPRRVFCSKLGLEIFNDDFSNSPPKCIIDHLRLAEYLESDKQGFTWDDIRTSVIFPRNMETIRVYNHVIPEKKIVLPGAKFRKQYLELNRLRNENQAQKEEFDRSQIILSVYNPLIIKLQEVILKSNQNDNVVRDYIQKIVIPVKHRSECLQLIESLKNDILLWAGIRFYLPSYLKCDDAEQFFHRNHLRVPYAIEKEDCKYCIDNKDGFCKRLECRMIGYKQGIPISDRTQRIEFIGSNFNISRQAIEYCKSLEQSQPLSGLRKLREVINSGYTVSVYSGAGLQNLDTLSVNEVDVNTAEMWIVKKLLENNSIIKIEAAIIKMYGVKKGTSLVQDVLLAQKTYPSDNNEICLTNYQLSPDIKMPILKRCSCCSNATSLYCKKYNKLFVNKIKEVPAEVNEIMRFFGDGNQSVEIDPIRKSNTIDVELENPGELMSVDINVEKPLNDNKIWHEAQLQQLEIETPDAIEFDSPLEILLGETGEGMILDDSLL